MFLISWECFVYNGIHLYLILYIPRIHKYFISMTRTYLSILFNSFYFYQCLNLWINHHITNSLTVLLHIKKNLRWNALWLIHKKNPSIFDYTFFNVISGEQWMEANNFIFSNIITYERRAIYWNDIRNAEFSKKYNLTVICEQIS